MFKKRVVSLLCASAMALAAFNGVVFAAEPGTPVLRLEAQDKSVQPYEEAVYNVVLDPNGAEVANMQVDIKFNSHNVNFTGYEAAEGVNFVVVPSSSDANELRMVVHPSLDEKDNVANFEGETTLGTISFKQPDDESKEEEDFYVTVLQDQYNVTCAADNDPAKDNKLAGDVDTINFEYKVELNLTSDDTAEMGMDYQVDIGISNLNDLINQGSYTPVVAQFDVVYDSNAFVFNKPITDDVNDFYAYEEEPGVVHVVAGDLSLEALNEDLGSLNFVTKVVKDGTQATFTTANEDFEAINADYDIVTMGTETENLDVNSFSREIIDSFIKEADGVTIENGKVSVIANQQSFWEATIWNIDEEAWQESEEFVLKTDDYNFPLKVVDAEGNDSVIGTTSHFVVDRKVIVNEGVEDTVFGEYGLTSSEVTIDIYDLSMRIKGDVSLSGQNVYRPDPDYPDVTEGQIVNVTDLTYLKNWLLQGIPADTDADIVWAATNIRTPEGTNTEVFIYDLLAVKYLILGA